MAKNKKIIKHLPLALASFAMSLGVFISVNGFRNSTVETEAYYEPSTHYEVSDTTSELNSYYSSITSNLSGDSLLSALRSLNSEKRKKTMGYNTMGTSSSSSPYVYTDYPLGTTTTDANGQIRGTSIASFYTKTTSTSFNKEHVWPNSHGGDEVEADILHTRPTISSENSSRGNSFYVEGKCSQSAGWDPYTAGYDAACRGECARIILYSVVACSKFSLSDADSHSTSNANPDNLMGNMNTLVKWHYEYSPSVYEINRNNGAEYLQGNRNPFVDHPEYVAKIWSNFNSTVSNLIQQNESMYDNWVPGSASTYGSNDAVNFTGVTISKSTASLAVDGTTTISATSSDSSNITWTNSNSSVISLSSTSSASGTSITLTGLAEGTATITAKATISGTNYTKTCTVTVTSSGSGSGGDSGEGGETEGNGTISFGSGSGRTNVTTTSATGSDSLNNTWTITTSGTTSFTPNANYAQIGSSSKPASSISFTTSLSSAATVTDFSASLGGFSGTAGTVTLKVGNTSVGTGNLSGTTDVTVSATDKTQTGSSLSVSISGISKGVKAYSISYTLSSGSSSTKTLSSISVATAPTTTTYTAGEYFDPTGLVITRTYSDSSSDTYTYSGHTSEFSFTPSTSTALTTSNSSVTISYGGKSCAQAITVNAAKTLSSISVSTAPTNTSYYAGQTFDPTGLVIKRTYSDSTYDTYTYSGHTSEFSFSPSTSTALTTSNTSVTITYSGKTCAQSIAVNALALSSISTSGQTTEYEVGSSFSYNGTCTATFNSGATQSVTPTVNSSAVNMNAEGTYTVILSYTYSGVTKTTSYTITVSEVPFVNTIEQLYSKSKGSLGSYVFYGLYMGYTTHTYNSTLYYDLYIGNGDFGILIYQFITSKPSYVAYETYLSFTGGYLDIYNNLYEVKSQSGSTLSISTLTSSQAAQYVAPITTYQITGDEVGSDATYKKTASRPATLSGTVTAISKSIAKANDSEVTIELSSGKTSLVFVKKNADNLDYSTLASKLTVNSTVNLKGFTSIYSEKYQLVNPEVVEASSNYGAAEFSQDLLDLTSTICASSGDKETSLSGVWVNLEINKYSILSESAKTTLKNASASELGTTIEQAMARYDVICKKYASCSNFIGRSSANRSQNTLYLTFGSDTDSSLFITIFVVATALTSCAFLLCIYKKKKSVR